MTVQIVLVFGGREFSDRVLMHRVMTHVRQQHPSIVAVVHGDANGADKLGGEWARNIGLQEIRMPANWNFYKLGAGPRRNRAMRDLIKPQLGVMFPGGSGTANMRGLLIEHKIPVVDAAGFTGSGTVVGGKKKKKVSGLFD